MKDERKYRLAKCAPVEPLVNNWHAWSYLLSPVPASLHLTRYQLPTLRSYLKTPEFHVEACRNPALIGGPFVDVPVSRSDEVRLLLEDTEKKQAQNIRLAKALKDYHDLLAEEATGQSLETYYQKMPEELSGYVELVYDYYNHPIIRAFEGFLYDSEYYDKSLQSIRVLPLKRDEARPFFISTPRLPDSNHISWPVSFDNTTVDEFFRLESEMQPLGYIRELLGLSASDDHRLLQVLSEDTVSPYDKWDGPSVRVRYIGHACLLFEWKDTTILTDPFLPVMPKEGGISRYTYQDLPGEIDYALITHNHQDHFSIESLLRIRHKTKCIVVPRTFGVLYGDISIKMLLQKLGFKNVVELDSLESIPIPDGEIVGIPFLGEHGDLPHGKTGYVIRAGRELFLIGADSDCLDKRIYENIRKAVGRIDTVFLGAECIGAPLDWVYGPLLAKDPPPALNNSRRQHGCNSRAALSILDAVGARRIYNYAMGLEPWMEYMLGLGLKEDSPQWKESTRLLEKARSRGALASERLFGKADLFFGGPEPVFSTDSGARDHVGALPLSLAQESLMAEIQLASIGDRNNISTVIRLAGRLDPGALERSLDEVQKRHDILRASFAIVDGKPIQVMAPAPAAKLRVLSLAGLTDSERDAEKIRLVAEQKETAFELGRAPLLKALLLHLTPDEYALVLTLHRMICDSSSLKILVEEIASFYEAFSTGRLPDPAEPIQYADFAGWQQRWTETGALNSELSYWKQQLGAHFPELRSLLRETKADVRGGRREKQWFTVAAHLSSELKGLARREGTDLFTVLLAAFQTLLYRYTGCEEILVGAVVEQRRPGLESLVGPLSNILTIRTDLADDPSFVVMLRRARDVVSTAHAYGNAPFQLVTKTAWNDRAQMRPLPFEVMFDMSSSIAQPIVLQDLLVQMLELEAQTEKCDLVLSVTEDGEELKGSLEYNDAVFDARFISIMLERFTCLLEEAAAHPERGVSDIPLDKYQTSYPQLDSPGDGDQQFVF